MRMRGRLTLKTPALRIQQVDQTRLPFRLWATRPDLVPYVLMRNPNPLSESKKSAALDGPAQICLISRPLPQVQVTLAAKMEGDFSQFAPYKLGCSLGSTRVNCRDIPSHCFKIFPNQKTGTHPITSRHPHRKINGDRGTTGDQKRFEVTQHKKKANPPVLGTFCLEF